MQTSTLNHSYNYAIASCDNSTGYPYTVQRDSTSTVVTNDSLTSSKEELHDSYFPSHTTNLTNIESYNPTTTTVTNYYSFTTA